MSKLRLALAQQGLRTAHISREPGLVCQGDLVGVTVRPLAAGELGSLAVDGVFDFNKNTGVAYTVGTILYWDDTANVVTTTSAGNKSIGKVVRAAASADTTVRMRLSQ